MKRDSKRTIPIYELGVFLMTLKVMLDRLVYFDNHGLLDNSLIVCAIVCFLLVIVGEDSHSLKQWIIIGGIGLLCLYSCLRMKEYYLLMSYFLIVASIRHSIPNTIKIMHGVKIVTMIVSVIWYVCAYIMGDTIYTVLKDGRTAHHFGFSHPNSFALVACWAILEYIYLYYDKIQKWKMIVFSPIVGYVLYYVTSCDTVFYILTLTSLIICLNESKKMSKWLIFIAKYSYPAIALINFFCIKTYAARGGFLYIIVYILDKLLTARIRQAAQIYSLYGFTLFGQSVPMSETVEYDLYYRITKLMCDGMYSYLLVCMGAIYSIIFTYLIWRYVKKEKKNLLPILVFIIYGVLETHGLNAFMAFPILLLGNSYLSSGTTVKRRTFTLRI